MLSSCVALSASINVLWEVVNSTHIDIALEGPQQDCACVDVPCSTRPIVLLLLPPRSTDAPAGVLHGGEQDNAYNAFGPANPSAVDRFMGGADVVVLGYSSEGQPFAVDSFLTTYEVCNYGNPDREFVGSCDDASWGQSTTWDNVELLHAQQLDSVQFMRYTREIKTPDGLFDHPFKLDAPQRFIYATGSILSTVTTFEGYPGTGEHEGDASVAYGDVELYIGQTINECAPINGVEPVPADQQQSLPDGFAGPVLLGNGEVSVAWQLTTHQIAFQVTSNVRAEWVGLGLGNRMSDAHAYVAWRDDLGDLHLAGYRMVGKRASDVLETHEPLENVEIIYENGYITFMYVLRATDAAYRSLATALKLCRFTRALGASEQYGVPAIDIEAQSFISATGATWQSGPLQPINTHTRRSGTATVVNLLSAVAFVEGLDTVYFVHGMTDPTYKSDQSSYEVPQM
eukprot:scaffold1860_cov403-Prasinococcus_capsulatus_cf.AAC.16